MKTAENWTEQVVPWLITQGLKIAPMIIFGFNLDRILQRIIIRAVRASVRPDENTPPEA